MRANESILSPFLFHGTCLSVTIARLLSTYRSLPLSVSRPAARPSSASSRSLLPLSFPVSLSRFLSLHAFLLAPALPPPSYSPEPGRLGFRRKETTIRRIVATDHSWRVDRINGVRGFGPARTPSTVYDARIHAYPCFSTAYVISCSRLCRDPCRVRIVSQASTQ